MDRSEFPDIEPHEFSASYMTVPQELFHSFDFGTSQWPFSLELQQQREIAPKDCVSPETVSHEPISLEIVPDATCSGPNPTHPAQPPWPSSMSTDLSALTPSLISEKYSVDAMDTGLFQLPQPIGSSVVPLGLLASAINIQSEHLFGAMLFQDGSILQDSFHRNRSGLQKIPSKRGQKAATMSDQRWEPASDRIRQLYVVEGKGIKEVREKINAEFGFGATERQYKARISKLKLERKCTIEQRKTILRHVRYRKERFGKGSMHVRVRGHMLTQEKIARWLKEPALANALSNVRPPSPLPTEISIRTAVHLQSPKSRCEAMSSIRFFPETETCAALRILDNAQQENQVMDPRQARSLFSDIQQLLEICDNPPRTSKGYAWRPNLEIYLFQIRNMMNLGPKVLVNGVSSSLIPMNFEKQSEKNSRRLVKRDFKFTAWDTQHGRMELSFWLASNDSNADDDARKAEYSPPIELARITLFTRSRTKSTVCVNLDFDPLCDLPMKLTYQAMVPNDSEVFRIVHAGDVEALRKALAMKTASLTDRDEDGRSLLSHASTYLRVDMCKFLLRHGADMNAIELDSLGFMSAVHGHSKGNDCEDTKENLESKSQCYQVMLESGADLALETYDGNRWRSNYECSLHYDCFATFRHILLLGQPFVNTETRVTPVYCDRYSSLTSYPLLVLADKCREASGWIVDALEKVLLLLRYSADITVVDEKRNNILHCALYSRNNSRIQGKESLAKTWMVAVCDCDRCNASFREAKQILTAAIAAGADIYAFNRYGVTPTMAAEQRGRETEWIEALEECGINAEQVLLHTEEWKSVVSELDIEFLHYSLEKRAEIVENFESGFWNTGNMRQEPNLTFQQFCEQRDSRRKLQVDCDYRVADANYWKMVHALRVLEDGDNLSIWSEEESETSFEMPEDTSGNVLSHMEEELEVHQDQQLAGAAPTFTGDMIRDNLDRIIHKIDDLTVSVEHDDVFNNRDAHGNKRDLDMTEYYWGDDPFDIGSNTVGSPVMSFSEFMNIDNWNDERPVMEDVWK